MKRFAKVSTKGSRKNNFTELALRFGSGLADPRVHIPDDREHQFRLIANTVPIDPEQCSGASRTKKIQTI
jgi:hypothetical protein